MRASSFQPFMYGVHSFMFGMAVDIPSIAPYFINLIGAAISAIVIHVVKEHVAPYLVKKAKIFRLWILSEMRKFRKGG